MRVFLSLWLIISGTVSGLADDLRVVVNRNDTVATLYLSMSVPTLDAAFGPTAATVIPPGQIATLNEMKEAVSTRAARLLADTTLRIDGQRVQFEPMSMVIHPKGETLPFDTPWLASVAASVCTEPDGSVPSRNQMIVYAGFVTKGVDGTGEITMELPITAPDDLTFQVADYVRGIRQSLRKETVGSLRIVTLGQGSDRPKAYAIMPFAFIAFVLLVTALLLKRRTLRRQIFSVDN